jgi:hypothetical protein
MSVVSRGDLIQAFVSLAVTLLLIGAALSLSAGTLQWPHGLLFVAVFLFLTLVAIAWLWRVNPEIFLARRQLTGKAPRAGTSCCLPAMKDFSYGGINHAISP